MPDEEPGFAPAPDPAAEPLAKAMPPLVVLGPATPPLVVLGAAPLAGPESPLDVTVWVPLPTLEPVPAPTPALSLKPVTFAEPALAPLPSPLTRPPQAAARSEKTSARPGAAPLDIVN
jgi:hypothetical protein